MRALVVESAGAAAVLRDAPEPEADAGRVPVETAWSSINYKDALAVTGAPGVLRSAPLVPGIDAVGVLGADAGGLTSGTPVAVTGAGLGERSDGGFAERTAVPVDALVRIPEPFSPEDAATIGTAGFTAALAVLALERRPLPDGPVLVTGAGGGVGGFAVALLAARGREVLASTGRRDELGEHLRALGAAELVDRLDAEPGRPLQRARWAGVVDSVGGGALVNAIAQTHPEGAVAACGLAGGADLPGSVLPFILRAVDLLGINSVDVGRHMREAAWQLLAEHLTPAVLGRMRDRTVPLAQVPEVAPDVLAGRIRGRVVVDVRA